MLLVCTVCTQEGLCVYDMFPTCIPFYQKQREHLEMGHNMEFLLMPGYNPRPEKHNCARQCGTITVPFPFGLEEGCSARKRFQLNCSDKTNSVLKFKDYFQVTYINVSEGLLGVKHNSSLEEQLFNMMMEMMTSDNEPDLFVDPLESVSVQWAVANLTCQEAQHNTSGYACVSTSSSCLNVLSSMDGYVGYRCSCLPGYRGNPYILDGCEGNSPTSSPKLNMIAAKVTLNSNL